MKLVFAIAVVFIGCTAVGCGPSTPSDSEQKKMAQDFSSEHLAQTLEAQGRTKEAEDLRKGASQQ